MVIVARSGRPRAITDFSSSEPVGQAVTQAPHDTHSELMKGCCWPATMREAKPRPDTVSAKVPWMSAQARTQR